MYALKTLLKLTVWLEQNPKIHIVKEDDISAEPNIVIATNSPKNKAKIITTIIEDMSPREIIEKISLDILE